MSDFLKVVWVCVGRPLATAIFSIMFAGTMILAGLFFTIGFPFRYLFWKLGLLNRSDVYWDRY